MIPQLDGNISFLSNSSLLSSNTYLEASSENVSLTPYNSLEHSWFSQPSENDLSISVCPAYIPVIISEERKQCPRVVRLPHTRKILRRENKCLQALSLPKFTFYNMRSIWDKMNSFAADMHERIADISFLSEL